MAIAATQISLFKLRPVRRKPKVSAEEIKEGDENVLTFRGKTLDKMDFFGKSDPYLEILRSTPGGSWRLVHRTEVVKNNLNPSWKPFELSVNTLCGRNKKQIMKFDVYDWDSDGSHDYIGGFSAPLEDMLQAQQHELHLWWICWAAQAGLEKMSTNENREKPPPKKLEKMSTNENREEPPPKKLKRSIKKEAEAEAEPGPAPRKRPPAAAAAAPPRPRGRGPRSRQRRPSPALEATSRVVDVQRSGQELTIDISVTVLPLSK